MIETKVSISENAERRLRKAWKKLTQYQHYQIPESIEDLKALGHFPYFELGNFWVFANDFVKKTVGTISELLREEMGPHRFATATIVDIIREELKTHFSGNEGRPFEWHFDRILAAIKSRDHRRQYIRIVAGLELKSLDEVSYGSWTIRNFSEQEATQFLNLGSAAEDWRAHMGNVLKREFIGKTCILVNSCGDEEQSRLNADRIAKYAINCLRLLMSIHAAPINAQHVIGISLDTPAGHNTTACSFDFDSQYHGVVLDWPSRQKYGLKAENIQHLRDIPGVDQMWSLIEKENRSDLEDSLVTAITWFGEAQKENDFHVTYVKYWTSIEALVTGHEKEQIVSRLKRAIPVLVSQGPGDVPSRSQVNKAYDLRSKILHNGSQVRLGAADLNQICNWAWQCIIVSLHLTTRGYKTRQQVEEQSNRISVRRESAS